MTDAGRSCVTMTATIAGQSGSGVTKTGRIAFASAMRMGTNVIGCIATVMSTIMAQLVRLQNSQLIIGGLDGLAALCGQPCSDLRPLQLMRVTKSVVAGLLVSFQRGDEDVGGFALGRG